MKTKTVVSEELPVQERLLIRKQVLGSGRGKRVCIVTGIHGDELEGQYVCYELARRLSAVEDQINGTVEIWPAINPLGVDSVQRGIPTFDLDMNRTFPGQKGGHMIEWVARQVVDDLRGADMVVDIHSSNVYLYEMPQARISEMTAPDLLPLAKMLNLDFVWIHEAATVLQSTIAHSLNTVGTRCVVVEMGIGMRITPEYGNRLVTGLLNAMAQLGVLPPSFASEVNKPLISTTGHVAMVNSPAPGIVVSPIPHSQWVEEGQMLCQIANPLTGEVVIEVKAPMSGLLFTMRGYPVVYEGSLIARIFHQDQEQEQ